MTGYFLSPPLNETLGGEQQRFYKMFLVNMRFLVAAWIFFVVERRDLKRYPCRSSDVERGGFKNGFVKVLWVCPNSLLRAVHSKPGLSAVSMKTP